MVAKDGASIRTALAKTRQLNGNQGGKQSNHCQNQEFTHFGGKKARSDLHTSAQNAEQTNQRI